MNEWGVFGVVVALLAFAAAVVGPVLKLNTTITTLTVTVKQFESKLCEFTQQNGKSHDHIWNELTAHDKKLEEHGTRITKLEERK